MRLCVVLMGKETDICDMNSAGAERHVSTCVNAYRDERPSRMRSLGYSVYALSRICVEVGVTEGEWAVDEVPELLLLSRCTTSSTMAVVLAPDSWS